MHLKTKQLLLIVGSIIIISGIVVGVRYVKQQNEVSAKASLAAQTKNDQIEQAQRAVKQLYATDKKAAFA